MPHSMPSPFAYTDASDTKFPSALLAELLTERFAPTSKRAKAPARDSPAATAERRRVLLDGRHLTAVQDVA